MTDLEQSGRRWPLSSMTRSYKGAVVAVRTVDASASAMDRGTVISHRTPSLVTRSRVTKLCVAPESTNACDAWSFYRKIGSYNKFVLVPATWASPAGAVVWPSWIGPELGVVPY